MQDKKLLVVATYNIEYAAQRKKILENIIQLTKEGVDVFCLQELINTPHEGFFINTVLQELGHAWQAVYNVGEEDGRLSLGNAILWNKKKLFFKNSENILLPKIKNFAPHEKFYYIVIGVPGVPIQRRAVSCLFTFNHKNIRITSAHVDNVGGPMQRMKQVSFLVSKLKTLKTANHEIICGDFNTFDLLKTRYEKKLLKKYLQDFTDASENVDWTSDLHMIDFNTSINIFPWFIKTFNVHVRRRLDYIWIKKFQVEECKKIAIAGSDHFPIIAKLKLF